MTQDVKERMTSPDDVSDTSRMYPPELYRELEKRDAIISAIDFLANRPMRRSLSGDQIDIVLKRLGEALDVSRAYIFRNGKNAAGAVTMTQINEWTRGGVDAQIGNPGLQEISYAEAGAQRWEQEMSQGREIAGLVRDFPAAEQKVLLPQGIVSLLAVPVFVGDFWWGFIGFDHCFDEHRWDVSEIQLLRSAANTIGATMLYQRIEDALRTSEESERKFRMLSEQSLVGIGIVQNDAVIYANNALTEVLGMSPGDMISGNPRLTDCVSAADRRRLTELLQRISPAGGEGQHLTVQLADAGTYAKMYVRAISFKGRPAYLLTVVDVSSQKRTEKALRESEQRYRLVAENVRDVILVFDRHFSYIYISPSILSLTGYTVKEAMDRPIRQMIAPDSYEEFQRVVQEKLAGETGTDTGSDAPHVFELEVLHRDGHTLWTETSLATLRDASGTVAGLLGVCRDISQRKHVQAKLVETIGKLRQSLEGTINAIARTVEIRDPYTAGHQKRVAELASAIAGRMGLSADTIEGIRMAGLIHDIGKIAVPAEILSKPGRITSIELGLIKNHPAVGYQILKDVNFSWPVAEITLQHHERLDGSGYPNGIRGDDILPEARIIAVADVVEAMASHRPYRPALGIEKALEEIQAHAGRLYDAGAVRACVELFNDNAFVFSD